MKEEDAYPALPEDGNVYGPLGTYKGGCEKAPAAICRKVIEAKSSGKHEIQIWGDGHQTRLYVQRRLRKRHADDHGKRGS